VCIRKEKTRKGLTWAEKELPFYGVIKLSKKGGFSMKSELMRA